MIINKYIRTRPKVTPTWGENDVFVYMMWWQSNMNGSNNNYSSLSTDLKGPQNARIFKNPTHNSSGTWQNLEAGVNHQNVASPTSAFGPVLSFGYEMASFSPDKIHIIFDAVGGTRLRPYGGGQDWHPSSSLELWENFMRDITNGFQKLVTEGKNPIAMGMIGMGGETDAMNDASLLEQDLIDFYDATIDRMENTYGIDTSRMRISQGRINNQYPSFIEAEEARTAIENFGNNYTRSRWYDTDIYPLTGDLLHMTADGQVSHGEDLATYYKQFI